LVTGEEDAWGIHTVSVHYQFGDNERKMCEDMVAAGREMFEEAGIEVVGTDSQMLTEGWSIHELGTARMGNDPKTSVVNQFQQSHDVKNLFVVDGSTHVSASCQNPTWTIMALAWRSCEYLASEFKKGNVRRSRVAKCSRPPPRPCRHRSYAQGPQRRQRRQARLVRAGRSP